MGTVRMSSETMLVNIDRDWLGKSVQAVYFFRHKSGLLLVNAAKVPTRDLHNFPDFVWAVSVLCCSLYFVQNMQSRKAQKILF